MDHENTDLIEVQMAATRQSITDKVAALEDSVVGKVQSATTAVTDTVQSVKNAVGDTVDAVKENVANALDVGRHVRENPWTAVGTAACVGLFAGIAIFRKSATAATLAAPAPAIQPRPLVTAAPERHSSPGLFDSLIGRVSDELKKLGEIAIERFSSELHRAVDDSVPKIVDRLTFVPKVSVDADKVSNRIWNGAMDPLRRAM